MNSVTQACASGVWWLSRLGMYSCKGKFHWHSLKMHTKHQPVAKSAPKNHRWVRFKKKTPCRKALRDFGCFFDRGRNEQNKKRWQRFEAGTRTPSYCMHSTSRGCHEIHDDFSSRRLNTHLRRICLRILIQLGTSTHCQVWMVFCMVIWPYRASWNIHWVWSCQSAALLWHAAGIAQILRWNNQRTKGPALVIHPGIQTSSHNKMVFHCLKDRSFVWKSSNKC